jgi:WD40 repeat protein
MSLWDRANDKILQYISYGEGQIEFLSDGRLVSCWNIPRLNVWNLTSGQFDFSFAQDADVFEETYNGLLAVDSGWNVNLWNLTSGELTESISIGKEVHTLRQTNYSNYLACGDDAGNIYLINLTSMEVDAQFNGPYSTLKNKIFLLTKVELLLTASEDGFLQVWNMSTENYISMFNPYYDDINFAELLTNDTLVIVGNQNYLLLLNFDSNYQFHVLNRFFFPTGISEIYDMKRINGNYLFISFDNGTDKNSLGVYNLSTLECMHVLKFSDQDELWNLGTPSIGYFINYKRKNTLKIGLLLL